MATTELKVQKAEDGRHLAIRLEQDGETLGEVRLDAAAAEQHVQQVAEQRAGLADEVPAKLKSGSPLTATFDPVWQVQGAEGGVVIMALRHPGLGWLSFALPPEEVEPFTNALRGKR